MNDTPGDTPDPPARATPPGNTLTDTPARAPEEGPLRGRGVRSLSLADDLRFNLQFMLPYLLQGIFTRERFWVGFFARVHRDPLAVRLLSAFRRKYGSDYLSLHMLNSKALLVLDVEGVRQVLDNSPLRYADPPAKRNGMARFQPGAVTISRDAAWRDRRRFNEAVLHGPQQAHPRAGPFLEIVAREAGATRSRPGTRLVWDDLQDLFRRITLQVIFGPGARNDAALWEGLRAMMRESNRPLGPAGRRPSRHFEPFYERMRRYLRRPQEGSLVSTFAEAPQSAETRVENQVPHWMFAMNETLATNTARALALILAHPRVEQRVREELEGVDLSTAEGVQGLTYLEGCLLEAMRLWPTTPVLVREALAPDTLGGLGRLGSLGGVPVAPGQQVLIHNGFQHRDRESYHLADVFSPESWPEAWADYRFNHLSHGPQVCAGVGLALLLGKAVLAALLSRERYVLLKPALDPSRPLPHAYDYFALTLERVPLG
jgi:cytochrome P450